MYSYVYNNLYFLGNLFDRPINVKPVIFFLYAGVLSKLPNPPRDKLPWGPNLLSFPS